MSRRRREALPLSELVDAIPDEERAALERADALMRTVPAPPAELPPSLREPAPTPHRVHLWTPRRGLAAVALAAALAAGFFGLGQLTGDEEFDAKAAVAMHATKNAQGAWGTIRWSDADGSGNRDLRLEVGGLAPLPHGAYYVLWLAKDGEYAATCGTFAVGSGTTEVQWTVSDPLGEYDAWVVTARRPGQGDTPSPWLLQAKI